ncbi:MAG: hypothetical protein HYV97_05335 [Bdellovibrio sp.]|nr:hypothetical protein [Bdellovibrio sp.]
MNSSNAIKFLLLATGGIYCFFSSAITMTFAQAINPELTACSDGVPEGSHGALSLDSFRDVRRNRCLVTIKQKIEEEDSITHSRGFSITAAGLLMIQNHYGTDDTYSRTTDARYFFLFPRTGVPVFDLTNPDKVIVRTGQREFQFDSTSGKILSITGVEFTESEINRENKGGVEITSFDGILLDAGYGAGSPSFEKPKKKSTFRDKNGVTCKVTNSEIFEYQYRFNTDTGKEDLIDTQLKFRTDAELAKFLSEHKTCKKLDVSSLLPAEEKPKDCIFLETNSEELDQLARIATQIFATISH